MIVSYYLFYTLKKCQNVRKIKNAFENGIKIVVKVLVILE